MKAELKIHRAAKYGTPTVSLTAALLREAKLDQYDHVEVEAVGETLVIRKAGKKYVNPNPQARTN